MRDQFAKPADRLRMHLDIPPPRPTPHGSSRPLDRLPERRHHVFAHPLDEFARECALAGDNSIPLQSLNVGLNAAEQNAFSGSMQCHSGTLYPSWMHPIAPATTSLQALFRAPAGSMNVSDCGMLTAAVGRI